MQGVALDAFHPILDVFVHSLSFSSGFQKNVDFSLFHAT